MTDVSITAANVVAGSNARKETGIAGATITAGQVVYKAAATGKWGLADSDSATAEIRGSTGDIGIALNGASLNQPLVVQLWGDITIGGTLVAGAAYYLGDTPGGIMPAADLEAGDYTVLLGLAESTSVLALDIQYSGVAVAP